MNKILPIAAGCHMPRWFPSWDEMEVWLRSVIEDADLGVIVLPEYMALQAALIGAPDADPDPAVWAERGSVTFSRWCGLIRDLARSHSAYILGGTGPVMDGDRLVNRAVIAAPDGALGFQDKMVPTPWERADLNMQPGEKLVLFDTSLGKIGICICYDIEFPAFARSLAAAGADAILVPACTDTQAGQDRVQIGARARALENQCLVVHAPMVGTIEGCDPIAECIGRVGFFGPPDWRQPEGGIHALAHPEDRHWIRYPVDLEQIAYARSGGDACLFADWKMQNWPDLSVEVQSLGK